MSASLIMIVMLGVGVPSSTDTLASARIEEAVSLTIDQAALSVVSEPTFRVLLDSGSGPVVTTPDRIVSVDVSTGGVIAQTITQVSGESNSLGPDRTRIILAHYN